MEKSRITVSCIKKYVKAGGKYNNEVYVLAPGDEWGHLYLCRNCGEVVYSYYLIQDVNKKTCPKCNACAENNFVNYPNSIILDNNLCKVDETQLIPYYNEPTEFVSFFQIALEKKRNNERTK